MESISQQFKMFKYNNRVKIAKDEAFDMKDYFNNLEKYNSNYNYRVDEKVLIEQNFSKDKKKEFLIKFIEEQKLKDNDYVKILKELEKTDENQIENKEFLNKDNFNHKENKSEENSNHENHKKEKETANRNPLMKVSGVNKVLIFPSVSIF